MVALRIELSATRVSDGYGHQPTTTACRLSLRERRASFSKQKATSSRVPRSRTETLLFPKQACFQLHLYPINKVDELGIEPSSLDCKSKRRPIGKPLFSFSLFVFSSSCGSRTQPARLEKPVTSPEVERTICFVVEVVPSMLPIPSAHISFVVFAT